VFRQLANDIEARANDIPDPYLAAYAVENNATWLSADRGLGGVPGIRAAVDAGEWGVRVKTLAWLEIVRAVAISSAKHTAPSPRAVAGHGSGG
jgi:hypothetical protein